MTMPLVSTVSQVIGVGDDCVEVMVPALTRRDLRRARWAGRFDRIRQRNVEDLRHTHYLHALEREFRGQEAAVVACVEHGLSKIEVELAAVGVVRAAAVPAPAVEPHPKDLESATGPSRRAWARDLRAARTRNSSSANARGNRAAAEKRFEQLLAVRQGLIVEGDAVRRMWGEAFMECAALYTQSRSGLLGRRPSADPQVPQYRAAEGFAQERTRDLRSALEPLDGAAQSDDDDLVEQAG